MIIRRMACYARVQGAASVLAYLHVQKLDSLHMGWKAILWCGGGGVTPAACAAADGTVLPC